MTSSMRCVLTSVLVMAVGMGCGGDDPVVGDSGMSPIDAGGGADAGGDPIDAGSDPIDAAGGDAGECPTGTTGADCADCAVGYQDVDGDGTCALGCDATGGVALDCGTRGMCEESTDTGERGCVCEEGWGGATCDTCAAGWELVGEECEPALDVTTGLRLWYDADHSNVVTNAAGEVTSWPSRVGSFPLVSPSGSRPTLATDAWNGRAAVLFDAGGERVASTGSTDALTGEDFTVFVVAGPTGLIAGSTIFSARSGTSYAAFLETATGGYRFVHRSPAGTTGGDDVVTTRPVTVPDLIRVLRSGSSAISIVQIAVADGGNLLANSDSTVITQTASGASHAFVIGDGPTASFRGRVGEILVYDRLLTTAETTAVQEYITRKWGI
ncbi:MAG: hypothetical protein M3Y87_21110 [Myxococcota bacterium]|nr:hypothetical protein [Myxococcota bacterium]